MAATANERMGSPWHAAKHLETCAELCKLLKWNETVAEMYRRAGACYVDAGKPATGAAAAHRSLELIAKVCERLDFRFRVATDVARDAGAAFPGGALPDNKWLL